jgi:uncharacterized protein
MSPQVKRLILVILSILVAALLGLQLLSSVTKPQIGDRLELYQTDLILQASEANSAGSGEGDSWTKLEKALLEGEDPIKASLDNYQTVRQSAEKTLRQFEAQEKAGISLEPGTDVRQNIRQQQALLNQLDTRIGVLKAEQDQPKEAIALWSKLPPTPQTDVLIGLWSDPPKLLPNAQAELQQLNGWFRYRALSRLYKLEQRSQPLADLKQNEQAIAQSVLVKLSGLSAFNVLSILLGLVFAIVLLVQWFQRRKSNPVKLLGWTVPWTWDMILWILLAGFIFPGQFVAPVIAPLLATGLAGTFGFDVSSGRGTAILNLSYYLTMATVGLTVLYFSLKSYFNLSPDWFKLAPKWNWFVWGVGGYVAAVPLLQIVATLNEKIWQGQGGSNPLLEIVLLEKDGVAMTLLALTAAIAAPIFEETLFRGFLLPSLTRYVPVWAAIGMSALLFGLAHLSASEVIPLTTLGCVLGFVYVRSRSLLAVMLLHSLWNGVTLISLFVLGSGAS